MVTADSLKVAMTAAMAASAVEVDAMSAVMVALADTGGVSDHRLRLLFLPATGAVAEDPGALVRVS